MDGRIPHKLRTGSAGLLALMGLVLTASPSASDAQSDPIPAATDGVGLPDARSQVADDALVDDTDIQVGGDPAEGPLVGLNGAATALAIHDYTTALSLSDGQAG